jgi:putative ABC transport system ATP-binding protein
MTPLTQTDNRAPLAVECRGITKWFGEGEARTQALRGFDLEIKLGELTMVVGPSGCGKTTLISVIAGLLDATEGTMQVLGTTAAELKPEEQILFRRQNLGFVFQAFNLLPSLTAAENAAMPLFVAGWDWEHAVRKSSALLTELGLGERLNSFPKKLSGGQQQRVALARALVHSPRMIICDEPTSALDAKSGHKVMELLSEAAVRPDRAVIVVTHDSRVYDFADRIISMEDGHVVSITAGAGKAQAYAHAAHPDQNSELKETV